eukprot:TRINITY_DN19389_c0_g1_i1.p1 TRINITY_DN19389_c0_g1~~TRINITY_DN19389_c0_g1_i1.p1  ORF type:complete len:751 (+),score=147.28 TRINITY_DN19389_c0_g1_i1:315-2255(+)
MAVTGFEVDVVRRTASGDVPVPSYQSYNHHFNSHIYGAGVKLATSGELTEAHRHVSFTVDPAGPSDPADIPAIQAFNEHNGNEARQTYHGLPQGRVQLIASPQRWVFNPMQINTLNPDGSGRRGGPLPRASKAPPNASYSGLLECPCTDRIKKTLAGHLAQNAGVCAAPVFGAAECFAAAVELDVPNLVANVTVSDASAPPGCSVVPKAGSFTAVFNSAVNSTAPCGQSSTPTHTQGRSSSLVSVDLDVDAAADTVTLQLSGKDGKWFGVGFNASKMADAPYAVIVLGNGTVVERQLGDHAPGTVLQRQVVVTGSVTKDGIRTVVLRRSLKGITPAHYSFSASVVSLPIITALGGTPQFAQHIARASSLLTLVETSGPTCLCRGGKGTINGVVFDPQCPKWPLSDLLSQHNPTCDVSTYVGGMECCRDGAILLDSDQAVPEHVDEVHFKWRFYYADYDAATMGRTARIFHLEWALNGCNSGGPRGIPTACRHIEYDATQAPAGTPPEHAVHQIVSHFKGGDMMSPCDVRTDPYCADSRQVTDAGVNLVMAGGHCHSPACISMELYNSDTGDLLCRIEPHMGNSSVDMDESGYLWLPPCQWGAAEEGLLAPPVIHLNTSLMSIKKVNSTNYHYGVMAIWQMRGAYAA